MPRLFNRRSGSKHGQDKPSWHINNVLSNIDSFGKEVPAFNIKGEAKVNTVFGGIITAMILTMTLSYAIVKLIQLE